MSGDRRRPGLAPDESMQQALSRLLGRGLGRREALPGGPRTTPRWRAPATAAASPRRGRRQRRNIGVKRGERAHAARPARPTSGSESCRNAAVSRWSRERDPLRRRRLRYAGLPGAVAQRRRQRAHAPFAARAHHDGHRDECRGDHQRALHPRPGASTRNSGIAKRQGRTTRAR